MTDDIRLVNIEKTLGRQDVKLNEIAKAINAIAVQSEQIRNIEKDINEIFPRVRVIENFQASCPRDQYKGKIEAVNKRIDWFWAALVPLTVTMLSASYLLVKLAGPL